MEGRSRIEPQFLQCMSFRHVYEFICTGRVEGAPGAAVASLLSYMSMESAWEVVHEGEVGGAAWMKRRSRNELPSETRTLAFASMHTNIQRSPLILMINFHNGCDSSR